MPACCCMPRTRARRSPASRAAAAGCRRASFRSRCITWRRSASTSGSRRSRTARRRSRCSRRAPKRRNTATALEQQMGIADAIAQSLGYQGEHFRVFDGADPKALDDDVWSWPAALGGALGATFALTADKRTTAALAIEHLARHAPVPQREIALPGGLAVRHDRRQSRHLHDVPRVRRRVPRRRALGRAGAAAAALHRVEVRAVRDLRRRPARRARSRSRRACRSPPRRGSRGC